MRRRSIVSVLAAAPAALAGAARHAAAQDSPGIAGAWIVREMLPPAGGPPPLFFTIAFSADGIASLSGFGAYLRGGQGVWETGADGAVTFTLVAPSGVVAAC
jgi:hypothetical protein